MVKLIAFEVLFYLGCAKELEIENPQAVEISKHRKARHSAVKMNQWHGRRHQKRGRKQ